MTVTDCILAIDQGTTTTRAMVFDRVGQEVARAQVELEQHYPHDGWVEHDPDEIWRAKLTVCRGGIEQTARGVIRRLASGRATRFDLKLRQAVG